MHVVWDCDTGSLKITPCQTETDINTQNGMKFLSAALMQAIQNPTDTSQRLTGQYKMTDCLDLLSFLNYLLRKLDEAVYYP